jgi:hypothetical protein
MTMRQSVGGEATTASTAAAKLRLPALTQTARLPPNSGTVCASSTRRDGSEASASPSIRTSANGSLVSSTDKSMILFARSCTRPASGPYSSTIGCDALGRATKASASRFLMATMVRGQAPALK